mmetsp:Transcript_31306/g.65495  ORF Transcript_31306/g.65495 Transcript_31306/m.65495 type:complete len:366 (+) Transcript_31306:331-1428(+)
MVVDPPAKRGEILSEYGTTVGILTRSKYDGKRCEAFPSQLEYPFGIVAALNGLLPVPIEAIEQRHAMRRRGISSLLGRPSLLQFVLPPFGRLDLVFGGRTIRGLARWSACIASLKPHPLSARTEVPRGHGSSRGDGLRSSVRDGRLRLTLLVLRPPPRQRRTVGQLADGAVLALGGVLVVGPVAPAIHPRQRRPPRIGEVPQHPLDVVRGRARDLLLRVLPAPSRGHGYRRDVGRVPRVVVRSVDGAGVGFVRRAVVRFDAGPVPLRRGADAGNALGVRSGSLRLVLGVVRLALRLRAIRFVLRVLLFLLVVGGLLLLLFDLDLSRYLLQRRPHVILIAPERQVVDRQEGRSVEEHFRLGLLLAR